MSISNSIRLILNIKDPNIIFSDNCVTSVVSRGVTSLVFSGSLSLPKPECCPKCNKPCSGFDIIKHGHKTVTIIIPNVSNMSTLLKLKKQRYLCKHCSETFIANTSCVKPNHSISDNTYHSCLLALKTKSSITDIALQHNISHGTLNQWLHSMSDDFKVNLDVLPKHLCFDEFRSVSSVADKMSFICVDAVTGDIVDIVQNRRLSHLKSYFYRFPKEVRDSVETICIDMYEPYKQLIQACFPKAKIITDRFHIVQLINRSLNQTRIQFMNENKAYHSRLKRYWKLILKNNEDLDKQEYRNYPGYKYKMTESQVVDDLLRQSETLEDTYWLAQNLNKRIRQKDPEGLDSLCNKNHKNVSDKMKVTLKTLNKNSESIKNALEYLYSNGVIEGKNNLIKVIKRIAFGYRDFDNFRARILLISNTMIRLETKKKPSLLFSNNGRDSHPVIYTQQH